MFNFKILFVLSCLVLLLNGCATPPRPILQLDGQPISDKIVALTVFDLELRIKYQLYKKFKVVEDDEFYEFKEYLSLQDIEIHKIDDGEDLNMDIIIFNPLKRYFKIVQHVITEEGIELEGHEYQGDLTRKVLTIHLPRAKGRTEWFFEILDSNNVVRYMSFKALYQYLVYDKDYDG